MTLLGRDEISSYFYIDWDDCCGLCGWAIDDGELVGRLADGRGYVCSSCHEEDDDVDHG